MYSCRSRFRPRSGHGCKRALHQSRHRNVDRGVDLRQASTVTLKVRYCPSEARFQPHTIDVCLDGTPVIRHRHMRPRVQWKYCVTVYHRHRRRHGDARVNARGVHVEEIIVISSIHDIAPAAGACGFDPGFQRQTIRHAQRRRVIDRDHAGWSRRMVSMKDPAQRRPIARRTTTAPSPVPPGRSADTARHWRSTASAERRAAMRMPPATSPFLGVGPPLYGGDQQGSATGMNLVSTLATLRCPRSSGVRMPIASHGSTRGLSLTVRSLSRAAWVLR